MQRITELVDLPAADLQEAVAVAPEAVDRAEALGQVVLAGGDVEDQAACSGRQLPDASTT